MKISLFLMVVIVPVYGAVFGYFCSIDVRSFFFHTTYSSLIIRFRIMQAAFFVYLLQNRLKMFEICELINSAFEFSLLGIVTQNFVDLTSNTYWVFLARNNPIKCFLFLGISIPNLTVLGMLCFYCSSCFQEVRLSS